MYAFRKIVLIGLLAVVLLPNSVMAQTALEQQAEDSFQKENYADAAQLYKQLAAANPNDPQVWYFYGRSLQGSNDVAGAYAAYQRVLNIAPNSGIAKTAIRWRARLPLLLPPPTPAQRTEQAKALKKLAASATEVEMVTVPDGNYDIGKYDVTVAQYAQFVQATGYQGNDSGCDWQSPGFAQTANDPVVCVSWNDANAYAQWLSQKTGQHYRLPTEAEWQIACDGGAQTTDIQYCGGNDLNAVAWYKDNSNETTHPVGQKQANDYGLYDMSGNVWQWTQDAWGDAHSRYALRGGAWNGSADVMHAAYRFNYYLYPSTRYSMNGFRLVRVR